MEDEEAVESIELNGKRVRLAKMHAQGLQTITNGIRMELEQLIGYPNAKCNPYLLFYYEDRKLEARAGINND